MKKVENKMTIRTFEFGDLTVFEIPTKNYNPLDDHEIIYNLYVSYHRGIGDLYHCVGVFEQFTEEHIVNMYCNNYFDDLYRLDDDEDFEE